VNEKWHRRFLNLAANVASWSKDPSTQVGCVLVNSKLQVVGMGYNGFPRGVGDGPERYDDRPTKYAMVVHAEANAILNAVGATDGAIAYVTHRPCASCSGLLIQAGIRSIITNPTPSGLAERFKDSFAVSEIMLSEAKVSLLEMESLNG
jgi:dCMP deaminase